MIRRFFSLLVTLLVLTACAPSAPAAPQVHVENAWARPAAAGPLTADSPTPEMAGMPATPGSATPEMQGMPAMPGSDATGAVYFVLVNDGGEADTLVGATSDVASQAQVHETRIEGDVAQMVPVPRLEIPAHGRVEFTPGGYHVMLVGLTRDLKVGETFQLTLQFEKSGAITLDVPIQLGQ